VIASILFPGGTPAAFGARSDATADLHLDEVIDAIAAGGYDRDLAGDLLTPLASAGDVRFRQAVFQDIERPPIRAALDRFTAGIQQARRRLAGLEKLHSARQKQGWFLDAATTYCAGVDELASGLAAAAPASAGLRSLLEGVADLLRTGSFTQLRRDAADVDQQLRKLRYEVVVAGGGRVTVRRDRGDPDYSDLIASTFERFRQHGSAPAMRDPAATTYMNHIDARILDLVAQLHPEPFAALDAFCANHHRFVDQGIDRAEREVQFFLAVADFLARLTRAGLPICYPEVSDEARGLDAEEIYDVALAAKLTAAGQRVVLNDLRLLDGERIIVVTGPNQGGKTTLARTFGQLHHLAALGCPVPGRRVSIGLFDHIATHFERTEDLRTLTGKLEDELLRVRTIVDTATERTVVVMNETFSSTSAQDATSLGAAVLRRLVDLDLRAVYVTFLDELSTLGPTVVSMVSTVAADDPSVRTFKLLRRRADGRAYAAALAERHGLSARQLAERIGA
jgi:DNA mismatch repair protein MutS